MKEVRLQMVLIGLTSIDREHNDSTQVSNHCVKVGKVGLCVNVWECLQLHGSSAHQTDFPPLPTSVRRSPRQEQNPGRIGIGHNRRRGGIGPRARHLELPTSELEGGWKETMWLLLCCIQEVLSFPAPLQHPPLQRRSTPESLVQSMIHMHDAISHWSAVVG